jgi:hypothetical protein
MISGAVESEEAKRLRAIFINEIVESVTFWKNLDEKEAESEEDGFSRVDGVAFSIMTILDGVSGDCDLLFSLRADFLPNEWQEGDSLPVPRYEINGYLHDEFYGHLHGDIDEE